MKKYWKMMPVILYPYMYIIVIALMFLILDNFTLTHDQTDILTNATGIFALVFNLYCLVISIVNTVRTAKGKYTAREAAKMNLIIKAVHIPAYIFHFLVGVLSGMLSVWGLGFLFWAVAIDLLTIITTGINAIGVSIIGSKEKAFGKGLAVLFGICNFIYCIDLIAAIVEFILTKINEKRLA